MSNFVAEENTSNALCT